MHLDFIKSKIIFFYFLLVPKYVWGALCKSKNNCACDLADGSGTLSLISLLDLPKRAQPAVFTYSQAEDGSLYSYNPCQPFILKECKNVALCRTDKNKENYVSIGSQETAEFRRKGNNFYIEFTATSNITTILNLECTGATHSELGGKGRINASFYNLTLKSPCSCLNGCITTDPVLSAGSIILIIFFTLLSTYFVVGILYNKAVFGAAGRDMVPHYLFWSELPGLIKDGYLFFISPCMGETVEYRHYQRV